MFIELTKDLDSRGKYRKGQVVDFARPTITGISEQEGNRDWYKPVTQLTGEPVVQAAMRKKRSVATPEPV